MDLLQLNYRSRAEGEPSFDRNKSALSAWAAAEMREAGQAVMELRRQGARKRVTVADAAWRRLVASAQRWCGKDSRYRTFREKFAAHRDQAVVKLAIADLSDESIVFARLAGPQARHQYYPGADNIAFHGWRLHGDVDDSDLPEFAVTMESDVLNFAKDFEQVALDLLGLLNADSAAEDGSGAA